MAMALFWVLDFKVSELFRISCSGFKYPHFEARRPKTETNSPFIRVVRGFVSCLSFGS